MSVPRCVCGNGKGFETCCGRFLDGDSIAKTPEQLMRSRYTAYALGGYGQYLLDTWFPLTAQGLNAEELSLKTVDWQRLEVLNKSQAGDNGEVEFKAHHSEGVMHEISTFKRLQGRWYYVGGNVS